MSENDEIRTEARERLLRMVSLLGFDAEVAADVGEEGLLTLTLKTADAGRLIGRKGHCLQSLELLLHTMIRHAHTDCPPFEIVIDGYRNARDGREDRDGRSRRRSGKPAVDEERLAKMARDAAKEVKRWGEPRKLGPLNAAERRVVHMALRDEPGIHTESEEPDQDGRKRVVIGLSQGNEA